MKFYLVAFIFILRFISGFSAFGQNVKTGKYGVYADVSTYTELTINSDSTFHYLNRGATGIPYVSEGKWILKNGKLILYNYPDNSWVKFMPTKWKIAENNLCNKSKNGYCLKLQK